MREATLVFTLSLLIYFCIVSYYPIETLHVVTAVLSGSLLFGLLRAYDTILKMEAKDEADARTTRTDGR